MPDSPLLMSAAELSAAYRQRRLSPVEVVRALSDRIESLNPVINAFTTLTLDDAERSARSCESAILRGDRRPLLGVPIAIKDMIDTAGVRTMRGSSIFAGNVPEVDAAIVSHLKRAGAILMGKTATHEFAWGFTTDNPHFGPTRNPWNPARVPGGSSGGSAAAVAAGMVPIAIGTDTGGSIRVPASFCGIAGLKPTFGRVGRQGVFPLAPSLDHVGPMARDPSDLGEVLRALQGEAGTGLERTPGPTAPASLNGIAIGIVDDADHPVPAPGVQRVFASACDVLHLAGARIVQAGQLSMPPASEVFRPILLAEALHVHRAAGLYPSRRDEYGPDVQRRLELAEGISLDEYLAAAARRSVIREALDSAHRRVHLTVSLCSAITAPPIASDHPDDPDAVSDLRTSVLGYTAPQSLAGLPSCVVRAGFDEVGMPVGIQITGAADCESLVLAVATEFHRWTPQIQARTPDLRASAQSHTSR